MKIVAVQAYPLHHRLSQRYGNSQGLRAGRSTTVLRIDTDDGLVGWGEGSAALASAKDVVAAQLAPVVLGRDPRDVGLLGAELASTRLQGLAGGLEIALWDILGKALGMPVVRLLGGAYRTAQPAYASLQNYSERPDLREAMVEEAQAAVAAGYRMLKMKVGGDEPDRDLEYVSAVREALWPHIPLIIDANGAYHAPLAIEVGRKLEKIGVAWFEEPLHPTDLDGYVEVSRALDLAVSGGETLGSRWDFAPILKLRAMDIIQPDVAGVGGIGEAVRIAALASAFHVRFCPHAWGGVIQRAATLHLLASLPDWRYSPLVPDSAPLECDTSPNPLRDDLLLTPLRLDGSGRVIVPTGPGLGVEVNLDALEKHAWRDA